MFNSGSVRHQIGPIKKRILQQIELAQQLLSDYDVHATSPVFTPLSDEELTSFHHDLTDARLQLLNLYSKIQLLHDDWSSARKAEQNEEQIHHEYIQKYGDYSTAVQEAVTMLDNIGVIFNAVDDKFVRRQLSLPRAEEQYSHTPHDTGRKPRETRPRRATPPHSL
ncbi:hypothetical protein Q1695_015734 [Nippostrongylus brasiliensis]|nr:hypothetical protein Q1695_015734 [Nippostrongylus brasiliensis]